MARIVVITHRYDRLEGFSLRQLRFRNLYLIGDIADEMRRRGHDVVIQYGVPEYPLAGDIALLHVNATRVPQEYLDFAATFSRCINIDVTDISKRRISGALLQPGEQWTGPVIVKSNLNCAGGPEVRLNRAARRRFAAEPFPAARFVHHYTIYPNLELVPAAVSADPALVVERFIPESDPSGYALRFWVFFGEHERCTRYVSSEPILKGASVVKSEPVEVPEALRQLRRQLGFDYGKFDFVIHEGEVVLLDANKTPGRPPAMLGSYVQQVTHLSDGLEQMAISEMSDSRVASWI